MKQEELFKGISIVSVKLVKEKDGYYGATTVRDPEALASVVRRFLKDSDREVFLTVNFNTQNAINSIHVVSMGSVDSSLVHPREVFKSAILSNASTIALAHNHPSGNLNPSEEDINITRKADPMRRDSRNQGHRPYHHRRRPIYELRRKEHWNVLKRRDSTMYQPEIKEWNVRNLYQLKLRTKKPMTRLVNAILDAFFGQLQELEWGGADAITKCGDEQIRIGNIQLSFLKKDVDQPTKL